MGEEYNMTPDAKMEERYRDMLRQMAFAYMNPNPQRIFWTWTAELITECFNWDRVIPGLNDVMGDIMFKIKGDNEDCTAILNIVEDLRPEYKWYLEQFNMTKTLENCGEYYRNIDENCDERQKQILITVLSEYVEVFAPYIFEESVEWTSTYLSRYFDATRYEQAKKNFRRFASKYKTMVKELRKRI